MWLEGWWERIGVRRERKETGGISEVCFVIEG
jgi:hypothetical protein